MGFRNTGFMVGSSFENYQKAIQANLMQVSIKERDNKIVVMPNGEKVTEFINCSYLGLDLEPSVIEAYKSTKESWGG